MSDATFANNLLYCGSASSPRVNTFLYQVGNAASIGPTFAGSPSGNITFLREANLCVSGKYEAGNCITGPNPGKTLCPIKLRPEV